MKKVLNGKVYDTETAKKCGEYEPNPYRSDFNWYCEELYQKKTGEFFLYGEGNANSPYKRTVSQNEWCGGEKIEPLTYNEAQKWAEKHLDGDEYIEIFGEPEEDETKVQLKVYVSNVTLAKAKNAAAQKEISISEYIEGLINGNI